MQVEAEQAARAAAKEGLGRRVRDAEARAESLAETVEELRAGLERQRAAADYRSADCAPLSGLCTQTRVCSTAMLGEYVPDDTMHAVVHAG